MTPIKNFSECVSGTLYAVFPLAQMVASQPESGALWKRKNQNLAISQRAVNPSRATKPTPQHSTNLTIKNSPAPQRKNNRSMSQQSPFTRGFFHYMTIFRPGTARARQPHRPSSQKPYPIT